MSKGQRLLTDSQWARAFTDAESYLHTKAQSAPTVIWKLGVGDLTSIISVVLGIIFSFRVHFSPFFEANMWFMGLQRVGHD